MNIFDCWHINIEGVNLIQAQPLIDSLNSLEGVKAGIYSRESGIEFKECLVPLLVDLGVQVTAQLFANVLWDYLKNVRSIDKEPVNIIIKDNKNCNIIIIQGDSKEKIETKISPVFSKK